MNGPEFQFACLSDQRLAAHALSPTPVWLWSTDATRVLWANPVAATIFDAASPGALAALRFEPGHTAAAQIARLAGTLPQGGAPRLERLRGFGAGYGTRLVCLCSRIALADNSSAVLVVATERAGQDLTLPDRAQRLLADFDRPAAVFTADGELVEAMPAARERFGDKRDLVALGAEQLAREASLNGRADGDIAAWPATILRLGAGATMTLLLRRIARRPTRRPPSPIRLRRKCGRDIFRSASSGRPMSTLVSPSAPKNSSRCSARKPPPCSVARGRTSPPHSSSIAQGAVANALATRSTWSGIVVPWQVDDTDQPLPIEMSGLPVFDRDRKFAGYRGFGICRDVERLAALERRRAQIEAAPAAVKVATPADNVLAFPTPAEEPPALSSGERSAFEELARELSARLKGGAAKNAAAPADQTREPAATLPPPSRAARTQWQHRPRHP